MKCDIIIPVWNQFHFTRDCIEHIIKNTRYPYRLILIDNASDADTKNYLEKLKAEQPEAVELIRNGENLGFVKAVNQGLKLSNAPYICVMNNDTVPAPGWLERMVDFAETHKDAGLINPQCDGHLSTPIDTYAKMLEKNKGQYMEMNQCQGFCMLMRKETVDRIGYLDEAFGVGGYDDTDYSMRAHMAGYRSVSIRDSYVYHRLHSSFNKAGNREEWVRRNQKIYYDKWGKHLRVGVALDLKSLDAESLLEAVKFAYGLAREWTWVYLWINFKGEAATLKKTIEELMERNKLPPHQNIGMKYFSLPYRLFKLVIFGKIIERFRGRIKDKRFDAVMELKGDTVRFIFPFTKSGCPIGADNKPSDWESKGKAAAVLIKENRKR